MLFVLVLVLVLVLDKRKVRQTGVWYSVEDENEDDDEDDSGRACRTKTKFRLCKRMWNIMKVTQVILLNFDTGAVFEDYRGRGLLFSAETPEEVIDTIKKLIA